MKIAIMTLHSQNSNYGTILQAYGLKQYLTVQGYETEIIDYRPSYSNGAIGFKGKVKAACIYTLFLPYYVKRSLKFTKFIKENDNLSHKRYRNYKQLCKDSIKADIFISGSDQIWNPMYECGKDDAYFLKFTNSPNKIAYASSLGTSDLSEENYANICNKIKDYKFISVREKGSQQELVRRGIERTKHVCDPVFLLNSDEYRKIYNYKKQEKYILVYAVHKDDFLSEIVDNVSKITGLKVIQVGGFAKKCNYDEFPRGIGPREFIGYIDNAELVITSSFHGTAFSLIFNKKFIVVPPKSNRLRLDSILEMTHTKDRIVNSRDDVYRVIEKDINYNDVNSKLDSFIKYSKEYLNRSIKDTIDESND